MIIVLAKLSKELKVKTPDLITRPVGRQMYRKVSGVLPILQEDETLLLDFASIQVMDSSFIDEFILRLLFDSQSRTPVFYIKLTNLSSASIMNIESVLHTRFSINNRRIAIACDQLVGKTYCIGFTSDRHKDIINYLYINRTTRLDEIASFLEMQPEEALSLLNEMHEMRILKIINESGKIRFCSV